MSSNFCTTPSLTRRSHLIRDTKSLHMVSLFNEKTLHSKKTGPLCQGFLKGKETKTGHVVHGWAHAAGIQAQEYRSVQISCAVDIFTFKSHFYNTYRSALSQPYFPISSGTALARQTCCGLVFPVEYKSHTFVISYIMQQPDTGMPSVGKLLPSLKLF